MNAKMLISNIIFYIPQLRLRKFLGLWLLNKFFNGRAIVQISKSNFEVSVHDYIGFELFFNGIYEQKSLALANNLVPHGGTFIDIGSNIGLYAIVISEDSSKRVVAIEPDEVNFAFLKNNTKANNRQNIQLCNLALSARNDIVSFIKPTESNWGSVRITNSEFPSSMVTLRATTTLDALLIHLKIDSIDLLKIDVEGYEYNILCINNSLCYNKPKNILCEYWGDTADHKNSSNLITHLESIGYRAFTVDGQLISQVDTIPENNIWFKLEEFVAPNKE